MKKCIAMLLCIITLSCMFFVSACGDKQPTVIDITPSYSVTENVGKDSSEDSSDTSEFAESETSAQSASSSSEQDDDFDESLCLIIIVEQDAESQSLLNYMIAKGYDFTADGTGFVTSINGRANKSPYYWMLYTDDKKNTTSSWGAVKYHGTVYYSASKGAKTLMVKPGCTYIWYYTKTNY